MMKSIIIPALAIVLLSACAEPMAITSSNNPTTVNNVSATSNSNNATATTEPQATQSATDGNMNKMQTTKSGRTVDFK